MAFYIVAQGNDLTSIQNMSGVVANNHLDALFELGFKTQPYFYVAQVIPGNPPTLDVKRFKLTITEQ